MFGHCSAGDGRNFGAIQPRYWDPVIGKLIGRCSNVHNLSFSCQPLISWPFLYMQFRRSHEPPASPVEFQIQPIMLVPDRRKRPEPERSRSRFCLPVC